MNKSMDINAINSKFLVSRGSEDKGVSSKIGERIIHQIIRAKLVCVVYMYIYIYILYICVCVFL